jgi:iron(III) transport system substrate-binding protein
VWIYTSLYRHVVDDLDRRIRERLPGVEPEWFVAGSEKVAARLDGELASGGSRADLLLTSDPFHYARLKSAGALLPYVPPGALRAPRELVDGDGAWFPTRISTMVLVYNTRLLTSERAPRSFPDLAREDLAGRVILGDPLASGTFFSTVAFLERRYGWELFRNLRARGVIATGGNSTVLDRVASGEFSAGACLLENVLAAKRKGSPVEFVVPDDGAILVPGPGAILAGGSNHAAARSVADLLVSPDGAAAIVRGDMHAPDPAIAPPEGAPTLTSLYSHAPAWTPEVLSEIGGRAEEIRTTFNTVVQR